MFQNILIKSIEQTWDWFYFKENGEIWIVSELFLIGINRFLTNQASGN